MGVLSKIIPYFFTVLQTVNRAILAIPLIGSRVDEFTALLSNLVTCFSGSQVALGYSDEQVTKKMKRLRLYSFVACPFCRKVDEAVSTLGLDVTFLSCPRTTLKQYGVVDKSRYRSEAVDIGGKAQFPLLVDPNTDTVLYESDAIVTYLWKEYGKGLGRPRSYQLSSAFFLGTILRSLFRPLPEHGMLRTPAKLPKKGCELRLWGYEGSVETLIVREQLCSMELPYLYITTPNGAESKRLAYQKRLGQNEKQTWFPKILFQPVLEIIQSSEKGPESSTILVGKHDILALLKKEYQSGSTMQDSWFNYSTKGAGKDHATL